MAALTFNPELMTWVQAWHEAIKTEGPVVMQLDDTPGLVMEAREAVRQLEERVAEQRALERLQTLISLVPAGDGHCLNTLNALSPLNTPGLNPLDRRPEGGVPDLAGLAALTHDPRPEGDGSR
jgi:hypothetical protein